MSTYKISKMAIDRAIEAAGPNAEAVARVLYQDMGRAIPQREPLPRQGPHTTYHVEAGRQHGGEKNAQPEGNDVAAEPVSAPSADVAPTDEAPERASGSDSVPPQA